MPLILNIYIHAADKKLVMSWTSWCLKSLTWQFIQASSKENIKAPDYLYFMRGIHQQLVVSPHTGARNVENISMSWSHHELNNSGLEKNYELNP